MQYSRISTDNLLKLTAEQKPDITLLQEPYTIKRRQSLLIKGITNLYTELVEQGQPL